MHKTVKNMFRRTNKRGATEQISKIESRNRKIEAIRARIAENGDDSYSSPMDFEYVPDQDYGTQPYHIARTSKCRFDVYDWIEKQEGDPSVENFLPKLKEHLFNRLFPLPEQRQNKLTRNVNIIQDKLYQHNKLQVYYTAYNTRREMDSVNPRDKPEIMISRFDRQADEHPYDYARVLGIFHADINYFQFGKPRQTPTRFDFLWIQRYKTMIDQISAFEKKRLPKIQLYESKHPKAFDFLDPSQVLRGIHIIPAFAEGMHSESKWNSYYINMSVPNLLSIIYLE